MKLKKILTADVITLDLQGKTKMEILENLLDILVKTGKVKDRAAALESVLERENKMSTGIQHGIAIPHGKTDAVNELIACLGIKKEGVDFNALDKKPCCIFFMTLSPVNKSGPHIQFLAEISQLLKNKNTRDAIVNAETKENITEIISSSS